ncbi:MAG: amino acid ABC transporter permease [Deltaproteobacteria bacterium]|nr:amino acid ABC transporter permease [Deltaproteobacteria bacterium]MBW2123060.1 amino acid ABC transporter permease [Deltaproteobacteria bacterium]
MFAALFEEIPKFFAYYNVVFLLKAGLTTLCLSAVGCIIGSLVGFFLAVVRITRGVSLLPARLLSISYIEFFRRVPFLVTLMFIFFMYHALDLDVSVFIVGLTTVCLIAASYTGEIVRAGIESVHVTQWEAADTMNFNLVQKLGMVILPQAWKVILPPVFSFFILFIKDTALASQIGVIELTYAGKVLNNKGFSPALVFGTVLALYFIISYPLARLGVWMEKKLGVSGCRE